MIFQSLESDISLDLESLDLESLDLESLDLESDIFLDLEMR